MADTDDLGLGDTDIINKGLLGQGAFGKVYLVENADKEKFAMKVMQWTSAEPEHNIMAVKELKVLETLSHDNVLVYVDSYILGDRMHIITELCAGGDLGGFLGKLEMANTTVPEDLLLAWLWQMACGLDYMHTPLEDKPAVLHRDLKPGNVFLTDTGDIRLGDMGVARILEDNEAMADTVCGTPDIMSPEVLLKLPYNSKADIWSLGCLVGEMATRTEGYNPATKDLREIVTVRTRERLPEEYSQHLDDLVGMMLLENVEKRITASAILDSDLLQDGVHREEKPLELLKRYKLLEFLTTSRELNPQPTDDLADNPLKLQESLDMKGTSMLAYHDKLNHRMRGRREDAETATLSPHTVDAPFTTSTQSTVVQATVNKTKPDSLAKVGTGPPAGTPHQLEHYSEVDYNVKALVDNTCNIMADTDDLGLADFGIINKGLLGQGAFGKVFLVENADKDQFALKVMQWTTADNDNKIIAKRELEVLETLQHEHVVLYLNSFVKEDRMYIITEFCAGGDVGGFLQNLGKATVPEDLLLVWLWQMACGLEYMHNPSEDKPAVLHRDVKPNNIFLTDAGDIRLGDVGVARILEDPSDVATTYCGTLQYMSPEVLRLQPYNSKTDIWSLGCCVGEMATRTEGYNPTSYDLLGEVTVRTPRERLPAQYTDNLDQLVGKMLLEDFDQRITASDILDSHLFQECIDRGDKPFDLLKRHSLLGFLTTNRELNMEPTDDPIKNPANLKDILDNKGQPMMSYHEKLNHRMHGRPEEQTVKHHPGIPKKKNDGGEDVTVISMTVTGVSEEGEEEISSPDVVDAPFIRSDQATVYQASTVKEKQPVPMVQEVTEPQPEKKEASKMSSTRSKKKQRTRTQRYTSNVFAMFNQGQIQEFKEAFNMIDQNRDGYVDKDDLFEMYTSLGKNPTEEELDVMINMAPGPINFTMFLTLFGEKLNGTDPEDVIKNAFACFDEKNAGFIGEDYLKECLMTMGDRWSEDMVDELFHGAPIKDGRFDYQEFTRTLKHGAKEKDDEGDGQGQEGQGQSSPGGQDQAAATTTAAPSE